MSLLSITNVMSQFGDLNLSRSQSNSLNSVRLILAKDSDTIPVVYLEISP